MFPKQKGPVFFFVCLISIFEPSPKSVSRLNCASLLNARSYSLHAKSVFGIESRVRIKKTYFHAIRNVRFTVYVVLCG